MRPPKLKTTLSVLRNGLTLGKTFKSVRNSKHGGYDRILCPAKLTKEQVASWLDLTVSNVEKIEAGAALTEKNAEIISHQTAVNVDWLKAKDVSIPILNEQGQLYTQKDFDDRQKALSHPNPDYDLRIARWNLADSCSKIAAILVRGAERGQPIEFAYKINMALRSIYFSEGEKIAWPMKYSASYSNLAVERPNFNPLFRVFENELRKIQREKMPGKECPKCLGEKFMPCPNCHDVVGKNGTIVYPKCQENGFARCENSEHPNRKKEVKLVMELRMNKKTGQPINCEFCTNSCHYVDCDKCEGKGRI